MSQWLDFISNAINNIIIKYYSLLKDKIVERCMALRSKRSTTFILTILIYIVKSYSFWHVARCSKQYAGEQEEEKKLKKRVMKIKNRRENYSSRRKGDSEMLSA